MRWNIESSCPCGPTNTQTCRRASTRRTRQARPTSIYHGFRGSGVREAGQRGGRRVLGRPKVCHGVGDHQGNAQRRFRRGGIGTGALRRNLDSNIGEGHPVCVLQGAIHQQRDPHPRVSHRAGAGTGVAHGRKLSRLLIGRFPGSPQARCCWGRSWR